MIRKILGALANGLLKLQYATCPITTWMPRFYRAKKLIDKHAPQTMDASCGTGEFTVWLSRQGMKMSGVNISEHEIDVAQKNAHQAGCHIDFQVGDLSGKTPFADASFDQIISLDTVVHIFDIPAVFKEFHRLLKPGGRLVLSLASFAPSGRGELFWGENLLRKCTPRFLYAPATYHGKSWLTLSAEEQQKRFYQHVVFTPATLETQICGLFVLAHQEYAIHLFTSLATDLIFGLRFAKYIEPLIFALAARLDCLFFSKRRPGYLMFVTLQKI